MKKLILVSIIAACASLAIGGDTIPTPPWGLQYGMHINMPLAPQQVVWQGNTVWEYVYDIYSSAKGGPRVKDNYDVRLMFQDSSVGAGTAGDVGALTGLYGGQVIQVWSTKSAGYGNSSGSSNYPQWADLDDLDTDGITDEWSYGVGGSAGGRGFNFDPAIATWAWNNSIDNVWHNPSAYDEIYPPTGLDEVQHGERQNGDLYDDSNYVPGAWGGYSLPPGETMDCVYFGNRQTTWASAAVTDPMLYMTIRLLSSEAPYGEVELRYDAYYGANKYGGFAVGPGSAPPPPLGSFDGDMDVDEIDIDLLADAIRTSSVNFALFDISGDGVTNVPDGAIDINDLDYLVRFLVDTTMGVGTGSEYGDFNLDGLVDTTDLTRLATYFGPGTTWAEGNANRNIDLMIDTTDLTILGTYFGFDASVDVIPEPVTLFVVGCGAIGLLRRRRS